MYCVLAFLWTLYSNRRIPWLNCWQRKQSSKVRKSISWLMVCLILYPSGTVLLSLPTKGCFLPLSHGVGVIFTEDDCWSQSITLIVTPWFWSNCAPSTYHIGRYFIFWESKSESCLKNKLINSIKSVDIRAYKLYQHNTTTGWHRLIKNWWRKYQLLG